MASIYEVSQWESGAGGLPYAANHIVARGTPTRFWYSLSDITIAGNNTDPVTSGQTAWGGYTPYGTANTIIPHFFWIPSYAPSIASEPKVDVIQFGDGYEQRTPQGISTNLIKLDIMFEKRGEAEATAIAHFLNTRGAKEAFAFMPPSPYASMKKFVCRSWDVTMNFEGNYSIKCSFEEVVE